MTPEAELEIHRAWRSVFLNSTGGLTPDGEVAIRDLEAMCGWMRTDLPVGDNSTVDPYRAVADLAVRKIYASVKKRLFGNLTNLKERADKNG